MRPTLRLAPVLALCGLLAGTGAAAGLQAPSIVSVEAAPPRHATVTLSVRLSRPGPVHAVYGAEGEAVLRLESPDARSEHEVVLTRLLPGVRHRYTVVAGADTVSGQVDAPPLPPGLDSLVVAVEGVTGRALTMLEVDARPDFQGLVGVDGRGRVVWYCPTEGAVHGVLRRRSGSWVMLDPPYGIREVDPSCTPVAGLVEPPGRRIHHDLAEAPDGSILYLSREERAMGDSTLTGELIRRWVPETGEEEEVFSFFEHLDPAEDAGPRSRATNWLHANSLSLGPRGNLVVGLAHLGQVVSVLADGSGIEWRLGGPNATHPVVEGAPFFPTHTAAEVAPGRVLLFDNRTVAEEPWSRAVEYHLEADGARQVWSFRPARDNWSRIVSSAFRMGNGHTLVTFGCSEDLNGSTGPIEIYEVAPEGEVVWHAVIREGVRMVYRATPAESIGGEVVVEGGS